MCVCVCLRVCVLIPWKCETTVRLRKGTLTFACSPCFWLLPGTNGTQKQSYRHRPTVWRERNEQTSEVVSTIGLLTFATISYTCRIFQHTVNEKKKKVVDLTCVLWTLCGFLNCLLLFMLRRSEHKFVIERKRGRRRWNRPEFVARVFYVWRLTCAFYVRLAVNIPCSN